jgi:glycosyltransferase involved in cell wall biosynthesis
MKNFTKISLIISTYNWPEALRLCLLSVQQQSLLPYEVIIADDGSTSETYQVVESMRALLTVPILHVWHDDNGFQLSKIRNRAIAASTGDYVIQIDGDLVLHPDFIKDHLAISRHGSFVAGSRVMMNAGLSQKMLMKQTPKIAAFQSGLGNFYNRLHINWLSQYMADRYKPNDIYALRGCNMAFWREDLIRVNGYNEDFQGWGREDNEIAVRLMNAGLTKRAIKFGGIVFHIHHKEADRSGCRENEQFLQYALEEKSAYCPHGISQYLETFSYNIERRIELAVA